MNWIDRALSYVDPARAARRIHARGQAEANDRMLRIVRGAYEGAKVGRRTSSWLASGSSADSEIGSSLAKLRDRSRSLIRDHHFAASAIEKWKTKIVGTGILPRCGDQSTQDHWDLWSQECSSDAPAVPSFEAMTALVVGSVWESGEVLIRRRLRRAEDGGKYPLRLQILEADFLDLNKTETTDTGYVIQGVEFDAIGRRLGYWLFGQHPGGVLNTGVRGGSLNSQFVPASDVLHIFEPSRPGQVRGVPRLAPVLMALRDMEDWEDAQIVRKKIEACMAAFITGPEAASLTLGATEADSADDAKTVETFEPGMISRLKPGEDVVFNNPHGDSEYAPYKRSRMRDLSAGIGIPYELVCGDLSDVNYSSYRAGLLAFKGTVEAYRWNVLIPQFCIPVWRWFAAMLSMVDQKYIGVDVPDPEWGCARFDLLDREAEAKADQIELQLGTTTWPQAVASQGYDPEMQIAEIERYASRLRAAGVSYVGGKDASRTTGV
jgi:lambda family phage portal protein